MSPILVYKIIFQLNSNIKIEKNCISIQIMYYASLNDGRRTMNECGLLWIF